MTTLVRKKGYELFVVRTQPNSSSMEVSSDFAPLVKEFDNVFLDELPAHLPRKRAVDFEINLHSDQPPPVRPVIRPSTFELKELVQFHKSLDKSLLRPSVSPYGALVFFLKKKGGDLRMVCGYRALNRITIPDSIPLSLISEALDKVAGVTLFSKINLIGAYHQMRIREEHCHKTAIRTSFGSFEWCVLCFGLTNALTSFTPLLSTLLRELNEDCQLLFWMMR